MTKDIAKMKSSFVDKLASLRRKEKIDLSAYGIDEDIYVCEMSAADQYAISSIARNDDARDDERTLAMYSVVLCGGLIDAKGKPVVDKEGAAEICTACSDEVVSDIVGRIIAFSKTGRETVLAQDETEKN